MARALAGRYLADRGYPAEAALIDAGAGDDFAEVRLALDLLDRQDARIARYERALAAYADPDFWEGDLPGTALAESDRGDLARSALAGTNAPIRFYD